jgi:hypothetical protein
MVRLLTDYLFLTWVLLSVLSIGVAGCHRFFRLSGIELLGYGAGAGVFVHGLCGLFIALCPHWRYFFASLTACGALVAVIYLIRRRAWRDLVNGLSRSMRLSLLLWLLFLGVSVAIIHLNVRWPAELPDGMYVFKTHTTNVKIQYIGALPADNSIPYIVTEYFVRGIAFQKERPIIPGNEVINRTVLMSLVVLPFRAVWNPGPPASPLGTFGYVGRQWPDVGTLYKGRLYERFLVVGIFLNSLLLLGLLVLTSNLGAVKGLVAATLLYITNPYFIIQTIYTWPKAMAGFFLVLSWNSIRREHRPAIAATCAALACHCHPSSIAAALSLGLCYLIQSFRKKSSYRPALEYGLVFVLLLLPWLIWTKLVLHMSSDLFEQNFSGPGTEAAWSSALNFVWIRAFNIVTALVPLIFGVFPFQPEAVANYALVCLPTVVGLLLIGPACLECIALYKKEKMLIFFGFVLPAAILLLLFSRQAIPVLHGWQAMAGALLFLGTVRLRRNFSPVAFGTIVLLQLAANLWIVALRAQVVGAHF